MRRFDSLCWAALALGATPGAAVAQVDYRNLDQHRPVQVEDAYTIEHYAFEVLLAYLAGWEKGGGVIHALSPELSYGLLRNFHLGVHVPLALVDGPGDPQVGLAGITAHAHYNVNVEGGAPAVGLRVDGVFPVGRFAGSDPWIVAKAMITRSFGRTRAHVNGSLRFGLQGTPGRVDSPEFWMAGLALDHTFFRQSLLIVVEGVVEQEARGAPLAVNSTAGLRWQWSPTTVLDLGVSRGLRADLGHEFAVTIGLSHVFGIRALMPSGRAGARR